jgi:hypothetical protein
MGKLIEKNKKKREQRKHERKEAREERKDNRQTKKEERKEKRKERREDMKENTTKFFKETLPKAASTIFQPIEDIVDSAWQGETDKEKKKREAYNEKVAAEEQASWENTQEKIFDYSLYVGIGVVALIAVYLVMKR